MTLVRQHNTFLVQRTNSSEQRERGTRIAARTERWSVRPERKTDLTEANEGKEGAAPGRSLRAAPAMSFVFWGSFASVRAREFRKSFDSQPEAPRLGKTHEIWNKHLPPYSPFSNKPTKLLSISKVRL